MLQLKQIVRYGCRSPSPTSPGPRIDRVASIAAMTGMPIAAGDVITDLGVGTARAATGSALVLDRHDHAVLGLAPRSTAAEGSALFRA